MQPFDVHEGIAVPLVRDNVDTDAIMPSREMNRVSKTGLADGLFAAWRYSEGRTPNDDFILNEPRYRDATILLGGRNFGCGSSREFAVWALVDFGFRCVIAPSFGSIFYSNCLSNGVLPVRLSPGDVAKLEALAPTHSMRVDLGECRITAGDITLGFDIDEGDRRRLLDGLDDIDRSLQYADELAAFRERDREARPWAVLGAD